MFRLPILLAAVVLFQYTSCAPSTNAGAGSGKAISPAESEKDDLKTAASSGYPDRYSDWGRGYSSGYPATGYGSLDDRYGGYGSYDTPYGVDPDYARYGGYGGYRGGYGGSYAPASSGYGGYGGYAGNGGLNSYYGYNNPYYRGANHLGYGYYNRPGYGNIYNSGVTPSLVTGYRGYSRK